MSILLSLFLCLLMVFGTGCEEPEGPRFRIVIENRCDAEIYGMTQSRSLGGEVLSSGGATMAGGGPFPLGERSYFDFGPEDFPSMKVQDSPGELAGFTMDVAVVDGNDIEHPCGGNIVIDPAWDTDYLYTLRGDYAHGFTLTPGAQDDRGRKSIRRNMGIDVGDLPVLSYRDSHGGFHGDGESLAVLACDAGAFEVFPGEWQPLPLPDSLKMAAIPTGDSATGYWLFRDRHAEAVDPTDLSGMDGRYSSNYSLLVYDSDRALLYAYDLDS